MINDSLDGANPKRFTALILSLLIGAGGCSVFPGVAKLAQPYEKPSQDHFSCGEKCRPGSSAGPRGTNPPPNSQATAKYKYPDEH